MSSISKFFKKTSIDRLILYLGVLAIICLSSFGEFIASLGGMILVNLLLLPLIICVILIPTIFIILFLTRVFSLPLFFLKGKIRWLLAIAFALCTLAIQPYFENQRLNTIAQKLISSDTNKISAPVNNIKTLAFLHQGAHECRWFCQTALLNKQVEKFIVANRYPKAGESEIDLEGTAYWLEKREVCPDFDIKSGYSSNVLKGVKRKKGDKCFSALFRLKSTQGICLFSAKANFSEADAILVKRRILKGESNFSAGFKIRADTVTAYRTSYYERKKGTVELLYRSTGVKALKLLPILFPSYIKGFRFERKMGFVRRASFYGTVSKGGAFTPIVPLLRDVLKFNLAVQQKNSEENIRNVVVNALDKLGPIPPITIKIIDDFFENLDWSEVALKKNTSLFLRIFTDKRLEIPKNAHYAIKSFIKRNPQMAEQFAMSFFKRLMETNPQNYRNRFIQYSNLIFYLSESLSHLPDSVLIAYREDFERLARDQEKNFLADKLLKRLSIFGPEIIPTLLYLIDDDKKSLLFKGKSISNGSKKFVGLVGLCKLGKSAKLAIPLLYERWASGLFSKNQQSNWFLMIKTLTRLGADPDEVWQHIKIDNQWYTREKFDGAVKRANSQWACKY